MKITLQIEANHCVEYAKLLTALSDEYKHPIVNGLLISLSELMMEEMAKQLTDSQIDVMTSDGVI